MLAPQRDQAAGEVEQFLVDVAPVVPGDLVVLAVGVVVAALGTPGLIAAEQHRDTLREQQRGQEIALLPAAQRQHPLVVRVALGAAVPGPVVALSVRPVLAVGLVVLFVVGDQVAQGEAIVGSDEVDACPRMPGVGLVEVGAAGKAGGELAEGSGLTAPEVPHRVAVPAVPL